MSNSEPPEQAADLPKKARLINAWLAGGTDANASDVAEVTDSSIGYASEIHTDMEEGDIDDEEVEEARNEDLIEAYADRLEHLDTDGDGGTEDQEAERAQSGGGPRQSQGQPQQQQPRHPQQRPPQQQQPRQPPQQGPPPQQHGAPQQAHQPPQGQQPPQGGQQQPPQQGFPMEGPQSIPVEQLRELDELLAVYEEEAQFELQNLPPQSTGGAAGKLFMIQKTRSLLRNMVNGQ